jgi:hypothetical protein
VIEVVGCKLLVEKRGERRETINEEILLKIIY